MKLKLLFVGAVAIGITSNAMAQESATTKKLCDLSTLKGVYTYFQSNSNSTSAGSNTFDGKGNGVANITVKYSNAKPGEQKRDPVDFDKGNFQYAVDNRGECLFSVSVNGVTMDEQIYATVSGDSAVVIFKGALEYPDAFVMLRGPKATNKVSSFK